MAEEYGVDDVASITVAASDIPVDAEDDDDDLPPLEELEDEAEPEHANGTVQSIRSGISTTTSYRCFVSREVYLNYLTLFPQPTSDSEKGESCALVDFHLLDFHLPISLNPILIVSYDAACQWRWPIEAGSGESLIGRTDGELEPIQNAVARSGAICKFHGAAHSQPCRFTAEARARL
ncbi:hypothetical protein B0H11DRAFT_2243334 [Mycena galericulata]|nr:hypothetical protein B0H11DRAFT_2243334 [Mycena galericulata]